MTKTSLKLPAVKADLSASDLKRLLAQPEVAIDTETLGLDPRRDPLCLVQICDAGGRVYFVHTDDWRAAQNLKTFLASPVTKVFHFALFDCTMILANAGVEVVNPYCTKIASRLSRTYGASHSYASLVQELLSLELPKELQTSDWSGPLTTAQLTYAANDVTHLLGVKHRLDDKLQRRRQLPSGISAAELNERCQRFLPTLVHLKLNGWNVEGGGVSTFFGH